MQRVQLDTPNFDDAEIESAARTVTHIAAHFDELKQRVAALRDRFRVRQDGYFTPSEDEETRHLLVSYWQARNALYDLVLSIRDNESARGSARPEAFLAAYGGAIVLVDAARHLRETYGDCPAIIAKLNEAEPHFGIPAGTCDAVQQSLTSPLHVWHLYYAKQFFDEHAAELRQRAGGGPLEPVLDLIERLGHRLDVSVARYAAARVRVRAFQVVTHLRRTLLDRALYGLQKLACRMVSDVYTRRGHRPSLPPDVERALCGLVRPGDVFITRKEHAMTNYFLPGYWPHAALYLGLPEDLERLGIDAHPDVRPRWARLRTLDPAEPRRVLEALKDGVWLRSVRSPFSSDAIAVIRPQLDEPDVARAIARGMFHEGKPYDFDFDFTRSDRLVCTEVVYRSYEGIGDVRFELTRRAGRLTLAAEDLLRMALRRRCFEPVAAFIPQQARGLAVGADAETVLQATGIAT